MDDDTLDRLEATVELLQGLFERAKDGDPAALADLLDQCQAALVQIDQLRAKK